MNAERLLDAMGLLDDSLIQEAEEYRRPKPRHNYGVWLGWAASFAVVLTLGYAVTHLGMGGGGASKDTAGNAPASSAPASETEHWFGESLTPPESGESNGSALDAAQSASPSPGAAGDASPDLRGEVLTISLQMDEPKNRLQYGFYHWYGEDRTLDELPEGCVSLGQVERLSDQELPGVPYTDSDEYVGCQAWLLDKDPVWHAYTLYVELPGGGYLECRQG